MIATLLGPQLFKAGMDLYFERHDGEAATVEDFVKCFEDASGRDLSQFSLWYHQAGTPLVTASGAYDAAAATFPLSLEQMTPATPRQPNKQPAHILLPFSLLLPNRAAAAPPGTSGWAVTGVVLHFTACRYATGVV